MHAQYTQSGEKSINREKLFLCAICIIPENMEVFIQ